MKEQKRQALLDEMNQSKLSCSYQDNNCDKTNISFAQITITSHNKVLFEDTQLSITYGHRYGLIGKNGIGKTSLLRQLSNREIPIHPEMDVYYMEQDIITSDKSVKDTVLESNKRRTELLLKAEKLTQLETKIFEANPKIHNSKGEEVSHQLSLIQDELSQMEASKDESIVIKILLGLGFTVAQIDGPTKLLSGGWRMRVALAKALYLEPTLLLLDEPTNHLDINATLWLTDYLSKWKKSLVIVSHNQHFLNEVTTDIINVENKKLSYYKGNYHKFKSMNVQRRRKIEKDWDKFNKEVKLMQKKNKPKKEINEFIEKKKKEGIQPPDKDYQVNIDFPEAPPLSIPILESHDVLFQYDGTDKTIIENMDIGIDMDTRLTIVGANGNGKTTVMNLLIGLLEPTSGEIKRNPALKIGYYNQHFVDTLPDDMTPIDYLQSLEPELPMQEARKYLGTIGLESNIHKMSIHNLSGGQKARVVLSSIQLQNPHLLFLDEPTNHLDIETIDALIDAINEFDGGVIVISHDMELIIKTVALNSQYSQYTL